MTTKKPADYQTPGQDAPANEVPKEPLISEHLQPEEEVPFPLERRLQGVFRYMGETYRTIDFYGVPFERGAWTEVYDPFIAKKARHNADFDTKGKDAENLAKQKIRDQREPDRLEYIRQQEAKRTRSIKAADSVLGRD